MWACKVILITKWKSSFSPGLWCCWHLGSTLIRGILNSLFFFNSRQAERLHDPVFSEEKLNIKHRKPEVALSINVGVFR